MGELSASLDSRELTEWQLFFNLEPFGDLRADMRAGQVAAVMANIHRKPGSPAILPTDLMPLLNDALNPPPEPDPRPLTEDDAEARSQALKFALFGAGARESLIKPNR